MDSRKRGQLLTQAAIAVRGKHKSVGRLRSDAHRYGIFGGSVACHAGSAWMRLNQP